MKIDWSKAPEWANYFAIDFDGEGHWFERQPALDDQGVWMNYAGGMTFEEGHNMIDGLATGAIYSRHQERTDHLPIFPSDSAERKKYPLYSGLLAYFPSALAAVANRSYDGNIQHKNGDELFWDRAKSGDEADALMRHLAEGDYVGVAWRALALLQKDQEKKGAPIAPSARNAR